jgi:hypothetical protein
VREVEHQKKGWKENRNCLISAKGKMVVSLNDRVSEVKNEYDRFGIHFTTFTDRSL